MRKLLLLGIGLLFVASVSFAANYRVYTFQITGVNTSTTSKTDVVTGVTGKPVAFSYLSTTNVVVALDTVAGYGLSTGSASNLYNVAAATNVTGRYNIPTVYLANDRVVMSAHSAAGASHNVTGRLLIEE